MYHKRKLSVLLCADFQIVTFCLTKIGNVKKDLAF